MELNKTEINFPYFKKMYETNSEQSIDTDFTLPDYYPEVTKVLKSMTEVNVLTSQCSESGVSVGGQVVITLLYAGSDDQPNSFTHTVPFTKSIETADAADGFVSVQPRVNYLNTKAIGPRKVEIHGSMALAVTVTGVKDCPVLASAECEGIYTKCTEQSVAQPMPTLSKSIFVEDDIQLPQSKPTVGKILRSCARAEVTECKFMSGKVVAKGDLDIDILYCPATEGRPVLLSERRGFSQIIDCDFAGDEMGFDAMAHVDSLELRPKTSIDGEVRNIAFEAKIGLDISPYCNTTKCFITDAFSGKYVTDIVRCKLNAETVAERIHENYVCKKNLDFSGGMLSDIFDLWCRSTVDYTSNDGGDILIKGTVTINILGQNSDSEPVFFERPIDYEYRYNVGQTADSFRCRPDVSVVAVNFTLGSDGTVDVTVELCIKTTVFAVNEVTAVAKINVDTNACITKDEESAVILYFAENESVWDIAGKYRTSPEKICEANGIAGLDEVCNKILLIPNV